MMEKFLAFIFTLILGFSGGLIVFYIFPQKLTQLFDFIVELFKSDKKEDESDDATEEQKQIPTAKKKPAVKKSPKKTVDAKKTATTAENKTDNKTEDPQ